MLKKKIVYIVHCVDAEGPLQESREATFERLAQIFGITLEATEENLRKLQNGQIDLGEHTKAVKHLVRAKHLELNETWDAIDQMLENITSVAFRKTLPDSFGNGWVYNWFCVEHVGYEVNPRRRDLGDHKVFDNYYRLLAQEKHCNDRVSFHYHPLPYNKMAHSCATFYLNHNHLFEILAKKIIDRLWFPVVFRAGFHTIRPDSHWFLEQWIPFDYSNQSTDQQTNQPDLADGRFGDWRRAPKIWGAYHPSYDDYQTQGMCRRWIFRCLNLNARLRSITAQDVEAAFAQANQTGAAVLAFTNHDFRNMTDDIINIRHLINTISKQYPSVQFQYCNALYAARQYLRLSRHEHIGLTMRFERVLPHSARIEVRTLADIFGPQPFLAIKDKKGQYYYDNFDFSLDRNCWTYTFDWQTFPLNTVEKIGIAAVAGDGLCEVLRYNLASEKFTQKVLNASDW